MILLFAACHLATIIPDQAGWMVCIALAGQSKVNLHAGSFPYGFCAPKFEWSSDLGGMQEALEDTHTQANMQILLAMNVRFDILPPQETIPTLLDPYNT